jgi:AcrR family transcriptional regulator
MSLQRSAVIRKTFSARKPGRPKKGNARSKDMRDVLLGVAREIVAEKSVAELSLRSIAERSRVNPALLNYYFGSLDALEHELFASSLSAFDSMLEAVAGKPLLAFVDAFGECMAEHRELPHLLVSHAFLAKGSSARIKKTRALLAGHCRKLFGVSNADAEPTVAIVIGMLCTPSLFGNAPVSDKMRKARDSLAVRALRGLKL